MRFLKKAAWALALPLLLTSQVRADYCCPEPCGYNDSCFECCDWCSDWTVYADYLYWRARRCDLDYVITGDATTTPTNGNVRSVEPHYDSGFRVGALKGCGQLFYGLEYTYFHNKVSDSVTGTDFTATRLAADITSVAQGEIVFAESKWDLHYDVVDLFVGYDLCSGSCFDSYLFGGFKYASIDQELTTLYTDNSTTPNSDRIFQEIDLDAYGVSLGLGSRYAFCGCLNVFGRFSYDMLVANAERQYVYDTRFSPTAPFAQQVHFDEDCWYLVSAINLSFGLGYDREFCDCCISSLGLAIGYEFHQWTNTPNFLQLLQDDTSLSAFEHGVASLGFDGLFLRLSLGF